MICRRKGGVFIKTEKSRHLISKKSLALVFENVLGNINTMNNIFIKTAFFYYEYNDFKSTGVCTTRLSR